MLNPLESVWSCSCSTVVAKKQLSILLLPLQILDNLEKGLAEDGSMVTLTQENRQGKHSDTPAAGLQHIPASLQCDALSV